MPGPAQAPTRGGSPRPERHGSHRLSIWLSGVQEEPGCESQRRGDGQDAQDGRERPKRLVHGARSRSSPPHGTVRATVRSRPCDVLSFRPPGGGGPDPEQLGCKQRREFQGRHPLALTATPLASAAATGQVPACPKSPDSLARVETLLQGVLGLTQHVIANKPAWKASPDEASLLREAASVMGRPLGGSQLSHRCVGISVDG